MMDWAGKVWEGVKTFYLWLTVLSFPVFLLTKKYEGKNLWQRIGAALLDAITYSPFRKESDFYSEVKKKKKKKNRKPGQLADFDN